MSIVTISCRWLFSPETFSFTSDFFLQCLYPCPSPLPLYFPGLPSHSQPTPPRLAPWPTSLWPLLNCVLIHQQHLSVYFQDVLPLQPPFWFRSLSLAYKLHNLFLCSSYICQTSFPTTRLITFLFSSESFDDSECLLPTRYIPSIFSHRFKGWLTLWHGWLTFQTACQLGFVLPNPLLTPAESHLAGSKCVSQAPPLPN